MSRLAVWAPLARSVEAEVAGQRRALRPAERGWWRADFEIAAGSDYAFVLDGQTPALPDPRSAWQPYGVHGPSRIVDPSAFTWTDTGWQPPPLHSAIIYELHIGTFTTEGTFDAAVAYLPHLVELGISHVEIMPIAEFSGTRGWGYDGVDLYAPHHAYGGPHGFARFVDACHGHRLAVILDVVYNHFGPAGAYVGRFAPYFTDHYTTPWGDAVNLDGSGSDEVRRFFLDNASHWLRDYHVDGLRIDAVHAFVDLSAKHFLEELAEHVAALSSELGRPLVLIAESDLNDPRIVRKRSSGGYGLDLQWNEDFHHALHALLTPERQGYYADFGTFADLAKILREGFAYDGRFSRFRNRRHGRTASGLPADRFVGFMQNHDQVGNRACGERTTELLTPARLKIAGALVFTSPFVPMLLQGEEWGASTPFLYFTGHEDAELARAVREGRRRGFAAFGWKAEDVPDPQAPQTFERSKLIWSERTGALHAEILAWYRELIRLRRTIASLTDPSFDHVAVRFDEAERWLIMERGAVTVLCNLGAQSVRLRLHTGGELLLRTSEEITIHEGEVDLIPDSLAIVGTAMDRAF